MAIEPISTVTAMQVQSSVKVQPVNTTSTKEQTTAATEQTATPTLEDATPIVANASESDAENKQDSQREPDHETLKKAVESINKNMANTEAVFGIHEGTNRVTIKLVDRDTRKLIKELPPEKTLDMIARVWEMAGILIDEKR